MNRTRLRRRSALVVPAAVSGALLAGAALAAPVTDPSALVQSAVGGDGHVWLAIDDEGVATLSGYVDTASTRRKAEEAALRGENVTTVINLISDD